MNHSDLDKWFSFHLPKCILSGVNIGPSKCKVMDKTSHPPDVSFLPLNEQ